MLRPQLSLVALLVVGGCAWTHTHVVDGVFDTHELALTWVRSDDAPEYLRRCFGELGPIPRNQAVALRELLKTVEAGGTPTDEQYAAAGCSGPP